MFWFCPRGIWDFSTPARDRTHTPCIGRWNLNHWTSREVSVFFYFILFYLFIYGCVGSSFLCEGPLQLRHVGATLHSSAQASHYRGLPCCGAQVPDVQAQQSWLTGPAAPRHVGSSQTRAWTHVLCIGRQTLNHCATREAPSLFNISCKAGLVVLKLAVNLLMFPSNLNEGLAE